jgi:uncharacterized membrane protein YgcG
VPQALVCTVANDGDAPWSGTVVLAVAPMTMNTSSSAAVPVWSQTFQVGPVPPGEARRFFQINDTTANGTATACPPDSDSPCWLYGQVVVSEEQNGRAHSHNDDNKNNDDDNNDDGDELEHGVHSNYDDDNDDVTVLRADIGVPLRPLKELLAARLLPAANVSVTVLSTNNTGALLRVSASACDNTTTTTGVRNGGSDNNNTPATTARGNGGRSGNDGGGGSGGSGGGGGCGGALSAAALWVHLTTAVLGEFSDTGFHLLAGETRDVSFKAWGTSDVLLGAVVENDVMDGFNESLRVHWLNDGAWLATQ